MCLSGNKIERVCKTGAEGAAALGTLKRLLLSDLAAASGPSACLCCVLCFSSAPLIPSGPRFNTTTYVSSHYCIFVLILLYMCPHTTALAFADYHTCVLVQSSHYYTFVLSVLPQVYACPDTTHLLLSQTHPQPTSTYAAFHCGPPRLWKLKLKLKLKPMS